MFQNGLTLLQGFERSTFPIGMSGVIGAGTQSVSADHGETVEGGRAD
jgi:hypothetical protein